MTRSRIGFGKLVNTAPGGRASRSSTHSAAALGQVSGRSFLGLCWGFWQARIHSLHGPPDVYVGGRAIQLHCGDAQSFRPLSEQFHPRRSDSEPCPKSADCTAVWLTACVLCGSTQIRGRDFSGVFARDLTGNAKVQTILKRHSYIFDGERGIKTGFLALKGDGGGG
jgi:hypothetical protein